MKWHLILMIVWSLQHIVWKIYVYSRSITISYSQPSTGKTCDFIRWKRRVKHYVKGYFHWYGTKHLKTIIFAWLLYGGFLYGRDMKKLLITIAPLCVVLFVLMWISWGFEGVFVFFCTLLFVVALVFGLAKWIKFVDKHIKD